MSLLLGCIADDYTGATDLSGALAAAGMRVVQLFGTPNPDTPVPDFDAVVIGLKTRSIPAAEAVRASLDTLGWFGPSAPRQMYFKYCSTFDSTPHGNIGPVAAALLDASGGRLTVACPAYPANGRTVYRGHLFVGNQLLSESGMERHPLNPMTDPNLVRFLGRQTDLPVGLIELPAVQGGIGPIRQRLDDLIADGVRIALLDAVSDNDLDQAATVLVDYPLLTGGTGLAAALPRAYRDAGLLPTRSDPPPVPAIVGPAAIIAGSCSVATRHQVKEFARSHRVIMVDPFGMFGRDVAEELGAAAADGLVAGPVLIASTADPDRVAAAYARHGAEEVAEWVEWTLAAVAVELVRQGVRRLIVAGGETSGAVVAALGVTAVRVGPEICPGVPWCETISEPRMALALKSGNYGRPDFFQTALEMLP